MTESSLFVITVSCHPELVSGSGLTQVVGGSSLGVGKGKGSVPGCKLQVVKEAGVGGWWLVCS